MGMNYKKCPVKNIEFIETIQLFPCLYKTDSLDYYNLILKQDVWKAISKNFGMSVDNCKHRWNNIMEYRKKKLQELASKNIHCIHNYNEILMSLRFLGPIIECKKDSSSVFEQNKIEENDFDESDEFTDRDDYDLSEHMVDNKALQRKKNERLIFKNGRKKTHLLEKKTIFGIFHDFEGRREYAYNRSNNENYSIFFYSNLASRTKTFTSKYQNQVRMQVFKIINDLEFEMRSTK